MTDRLTRLLETRDWLLLDGATGTNLFAMGLEAGDAPEFWNFDFPDRIRALHQGFVDSGSDVILTNSFGGTSYRLKLHNGQDRVHEINRRAAELAREVADASDREIIVAGSMGPTGELMEPVGPLSHADAVAAFEEQGRALIEGGADVLWGETISSEEEMAAIAEAAANIGATLCGTLSFDSAGRTMMGVTSSAYAEMQGIFATKPLAFGANCGTGASDLLRTILGLTEAAPGAIVIAKANAGIPKYVDGAIEYDGTPETMAEYARLARDSGARLIGGCCGTRNPHLVAMRAALEEHTPRERPSLDTIRQALGDFSSADDGTGDAPTPTRERRSRRKRT